MWDTKRKDIWRTGTILFIFIAGFIVFKWPHLFLPFYWDEAWSYIPAIFEMVKEGPSLLPGSIDPELYRGHPLLFYFLASSWIKLFGSGNFIIRLFPFLISTLFVTYFFVFVRKLFDLTTAAIATAFLLIQGVFLAQSGFVLPEILLAFLSLLCISSFLKNRLALYCVWGSMLVLTKESGLVLALSIWLFSLFQHFTNMKSQTNKDLIKRQVFLTVPVVVAGLFYGIQKIKLGWFFFPEHLDFMLFSLQDVWNRFVQYLAYVFVYGGRNVLTFISLGAIVFLLVKRLKLPANSRPFVLLSILFGLAYLVFSSMNFYSPRYVLSVLPIFILLLVFIIREVFQKYRILWIILLAGAGINNFYFTAFNLSDTDHNLGFRNAVQVHQKTVDFCEQQQFYKSEIATHFLMQVNLKNPSAGYLNTDRAFSNVVGEIAPSTRYAIISSTEHDPAFMKRIVENGGVLINRFEQKNAWAEIYRME